MVNVIKAKKPYNPVKKGRNTGLVRIDAEAAGLLCGIAYEAHMTVSETASRLIKYAAENTVVETEE